ncbi:phosphotransferase [Mycobacterium paraterrae]|uniref:Aminoglycoside phosphotransferase family protein n=1 Tax=Mycobacterium paraterrae TaxID=577492 RepID=A0ABY3VLN5_9MYCO|nr:phosphotransferase [Mycobacterium paraterrae]UMB70162.1 aminoglycoside phosphotransferase family protein [Mycobacterium paraterrae]
MFGKYVGYVSGDDGLHGFLSGIFRHQLGVDVAHPAFRAFRLRASNEVYAYEEKRSRARVVCKFYGPKFGWDRDRAERAAHREFDTMQGLRGYNLVGSPHHVVRPLGVDANLNSVLAVEFYAGEQFSNAIKQAISRHNDGHLYWRLKALAYFLATQHNRTANGSTVDFDVDCRYFGELVTKLRHRNRIGGWDVDELLWLQGLWRDKAMMWGDRQVWLHGDATPANFLFGHGLDVAAIDLERARWGDRMFDIGRVAGEMQHAFMSATGSPNGAEPFIGHFLWEYCCHFPDRDAAFRSITARLPYYMAMNLLRVARNDYIGDDYGGKLLRQSKRLLRAC